MWDDIKYIFQIPLSWFKKIHDRVFNAYGVNFLIVKEGYYGGAEIGIDEGAFGDAVNQAVNLSGMVKSVNDVGPDANGNVTIDMPDIPGRIVTTVNGQTGNVVLGNIVNSVNGIAPVNGNVQLGDIVNSVNGIAPVNGNVQLSEISGITIEDVAEYLDANSYQTQTDVTSYVQNEIQDFVTDTDVTSYVAQELQAYALTVDGVQAVDGVVDFNLSPNKWMKTDGAGHIATTDETPIVLSAGNTGYLYANNGSLEFKQDEFVTLSTEQTITGKKRFTQNDVTIVDNSLLVVDASLTGNATTVSKNGLTINSSTPFIDFSTPGTAANDSFIAMTAASGYRIGIDSPNGIDIKAPANQAKLNVQPTDTATDSLAIATCGYVNSQLSGVTNNAFKVVTNVTWNGTQIVIASSNLNIQNGVIKRITANANTTINTVAYAP